MIESHPAIDAMEGGQDVTEARYDAVVVEEVAEHRVGEGARRGQEEATSRYVIDHLLSVHFVEQTQIKKGWKLNIATGEKSPANTPFHFYGYSNFSNFR